MHGDDKGLVLPFDLAPLQIVIVPIYKGENKKKIDGECEKIKKELLEAGFTVKYDDGETTPGSKFNFWEMKGVPIRVELGERDIADAACIVVRRDTKEKIKVKLNDLVSKINDIKTLITKTLVERSDSVFKTKVNQAGSMDELNKVLDKTGGFVRVPFCTDADDGEKCAEKVKDACKANMRGSLFDSKDAPSAKEKCIACGKKAGIYLYAARQY
jgi:prolyl-tRNA synthetase